MLPRITITRTWSDNDVAQLTFEVCDGASVFTNEAYASLDWGAAAAAALRTVGEQIHGGLFDLEAGKEGLEYASGSFRARFHYYKPHQLLISTIQQGDFFGFKGSQGGAHGENVSENRALVSRSIHRRASRTRRPRWRADRPAMHPSSA